jgi:hypothetical protein
MYYNINNLPDELKKIIFEMLPFNVKKILTKKYYVSLFDKHYNYLKHCVCNGVYRKFSFNTYIEKLIKNDYIFIFKLMIKKEIFIWGKKKRYKYKGKHYKNYISFLKYLCIKNESNRCYNLLKDLP